MLKPPLRAVTSGLLYLMTTSSVIMFMSCMYSSLLYGRYPLSCAVWALILASNNPSPSSEARESVRSTLRITGTRIGREGGV